MAKEEPAIAMTNDATILAAIQTRLMNQFYLDPASTESIESFITVNNRRYPDFSTKGAVQHLRRLLAAMGTLPSTVHASDITDAAYGCVAGVTGTSHIMAHDLEVVPGTSHSGANVTTGGLVSLHLSQSGSAGAAASRLYATARFDCVLELKNTGAYIYS